MTDSPVTATASTAPLAPVTPVEPIRYASTRRPTRRQLLRNPLALLSAAWMLLLLLAWVWPELLATRDPYAGDSSLQDIFLTPDSEYWLGTDGLGRDYYSRVVFGAGFAFRSVAIALSIGIVVGIPIGLYSGWHGGRRDRVIMWVNDVFFSLPIIMVAFAVVIVLEPSSTNAMIGVGCALATRFARLARALTLAEKEELYVDAARITGLSGQTILRRYILPNLLPPLIVQFALMAGAVILFGATLSFLGVGAGLDDPDWGVMLARSRQEFRRVGVWQIVPPGAALVITILAFNLLGDAIRDAVVREHGNSSLGSARQPIIEPSGRPHRDGFTLSVRTIDVEFPTQNREPEQVLSGVSFAVPPGETVGIVGESGSGKSMTALSVLGLTPAPGRMTRGSIQFDGRDVTTLSEREWQKIRGKDIGVIFQEPIAALNPALKVGRQLMEPLLIHTDMNKRQARDRAIELLAEVQVPDPRRRFDQYPHEFSGGMAQRVGIAMALACEPKLLIADEPTTALDVTVQGQILDLLMDIQARHGTSIVIITHDLGVIAEVADRVLVMYAGQGVETGAVDDIFARPRHPYTRALMRSAPGLHVGRADSADRLPVIPGVVPSPSERPAGCRFASRCDHAADICWHEPTRLEVVEPGVTVRCHLWRRIGHAAAAARQQESTDSSEGADA